MLEIALTLASVFLAIYLIGKWKIFHVDQVPVKVFHLLFIIKVAAALALYVIYTRFYTDRAYADIFRYYDDSAVIYNTLLEHPWDFFRMLTGIRGQEADLLPYYDAMRNWYNTDLVFNDSRTMIRINAFLRLFTMGTYFPHAVVMCFLAMVGLTGIFRVLHETVKGRPVILILIVYLLPSTLLWTSGMIKEAFLVFALGTLLYQVSSWMKEKGFSLLRLFYILLAAMLFITVKAYVFFLFVPVIVSWVLCSAGRKHPVALTAGFFALYFVLLSFLSPVITGREVPQLIADKQAEFYFVAEQEQAKSVVEVQRLEPSWGSLILEAPGAFLRTLLLPLPQHAHNILMWFSAVENIFILTLLLVLLLSINRNYFPASPGLLLAFFMFGVSVFILSGWVTPIIGALVRYKVPGLPFLLVPFTAMAYRSWMSAERWSWFKARKD